MGLTLSQLTLTQRSLNETLMIAPLAKRAREVAAAYIADRGGARGWDEFRSFISDTIKASWREDSRHIILTAPCPTPTPHPYGLKGGAAREHLISALGIREARAPRDIDLIRRGKHGVADDERMARDFMARDYQHGARVELVADITRYLSTRDLTINEVASFGEQLYASPLAILDSLGSVARPSSYRSGTLHRAPSLDGRVLLKMLRLYAEGTCVGEGWRVMGIPEQVSFSDHDLAIHLNKAFQRGESVARSFLEACETVNLLPARGDALLTVLDEIGHLRHGEKGLLPDVPNDVWAQLTKYGDDHT